MITLYADGAGAERVGRPGGWAFCLVRDDELLLERWGREAKTTSLTMELIAALRGLETASELGIDQLELVSDCRIVLDVIAGTFLPKPAGVRELAASLRAAARRLTVTTRWVRAHSGHAWNEAVDALAAEARGPVKIVKR